MNTFDDAINTVLGKFLFEEQPEISPEDSQDIEALLKSADIKKKDKEKKAMMDPKKKAAKLAAAAAILGIEPEETV